MTVDGKPYLAGIGVGVENDKGIVSSQVLIAANRFAIVDPQLAEPIYPFVVSDGKVFIDEAFIGKGSITTAKIGGSIKSTNYIAGETGWCLGEDGSIEFNGPTKDGGRLVINNQSLQIFYSNGNLCLRAGIWQ
ncbi:phage tail tip fiber protein [Pseudomonas piscis]|uniref:phage tail tip fiber protein n=2 Tax=Pseudomonas TaxID=286 RepID=UPI001F280466|nr:DUF1983 domain-containing protein [Pseudomonas piscis]